MKENERTISRMHRQSWTTVYIDRVDRDTQSLAERVSFTSGEVSNSLVVKALDSQSRGPELKTTGWLQSRLSLSSFLGRSN